MSGWFAPAGDLVAILSLESLSLSTRPILPDGPSLKVEMDWLGMWVSASSLQRCSMTLLRGYDDGNSKIINEHKYKDNDKDDDRDKVPETANICWSPWPPWSPLSPWSPWSPQSPWSPRQGPRFSIRMVIGIFCSDTETGAVTPPGVMQKK